MGGTKVSDKKPLTFHHSGLVIAPNSYICAGYFDEEQGAIFRARKFIEEKIMVKAFKDLKAASHVSKEGKFGSPFSYYDICHSSVMRLIEKADPKNAIAFAQAAYSTVGVSLEKGPIKVTIAGIFRDIATKYHEQAPQLVLSR